MKHVALLTEYDGSCFHGWQSQENALAVQDVLQTAWQELFAEVIQLTGSSRTDAGVSAWGHVSDFRTKIAIPAEKIPLALNPKLPPGLTVRQACRVEDAFNSRFASLGKTYSYRYYCAPYRPAIWRHLTAHCPGHLCLPAMREALPAFCGEHDFAGMMDQGSVVRRTRRRLWDLQLREEGNVLHLEVTGEGFLYHMVRILAGTLLAVGQGKIDPISLPERLAAKQRTALGMTMPPEGLCLDKVYYQGGLFGEDDERALMTDRSVQIVQPGCLM